MSHRKWRKRTGLRRFGTVIVHGNLARKGTITTVSGPKISQVVDDSGGGNTWVQATDGNRPTYTDANGKFSGRASANGAGSTWLTTNANVSGGQVHILVGMLVKRNGNGLHDFFMIGTSSFGLFVRADRIANNMLTVMGFGSFGSAYDFSGTPGFSANAIHRVIFTMDLDQTGGDVKCWIDGVQQTRDVVGASLSVSSLPSEPWSTGRPPAPDGFDGEMTEWFALSNSNGVWPISEIDLYLKRGINTTAGGFGNLLWFEDFNRRDLVSFTSSKLASMKSATNPALSFDAVASHELTYNGVSSALSGRASITSTGGEVLSSSAAIAPTSSTITLFAVLKCSTATTHVLFTSRGLGTGGFYVILSSGAIQVLYNNPNGSHTVKNGTTSIGTSLVRRLIVTLDASAPNSGITIYVDGVNDGGTYVDSSGSAGTIGSAVWDLLAFSDRTTGLAAEVSMMGAFDGTPYNISLFDQWLSDQHDNAHISTIIPGTSTTTAAIGAKASFSASAAGTSTAAVVVTSLAAATGTSTASATISGKANTTDAAAGTSTASATISGKGNMVGSSAGTTTAASTFTAKGNVAASSSGSASVSGTGSGGGGSSALNAAHRTSGVAPLSVSFDAVADTGVVQPPLVSSRREYADLHYHWDFGDTGAENFRASGRSSRYAYGYQACHVFETAGTFTVTLTVTEANGTVSTYTQDITVSAFSGNTYYVSTTGSNANNGTSTGTPWQTIDYALTHISGSNNRILLKRGDTFTTSTGYAISGSDYPTILGAYGSGAKPKISYSDKWTAFNLYKSDVRFVDLEVVGPITDYTTANTAISEESAFTAQAFLSNVLFLRVDVSRFATGFAWSNVGGAGNFANMVLQSCHSFENTTNGSFIGSSQLGLLGNIIEDVGISHGIRIWQAYHSAICDNRVSRSGGDRPALKFHAPTEAEVAAGQPRTAHTVIYGNEWQGHATVCSIETENSSEDERVSDILFERNVVKAMSDTSNGVDLHARYVTVRNNVIDFTGTSVTDDLRGSGIYQRGIEPTPLGHRFLNNTVYYGGSASTITFVETDATATGTIVRNNLGCAPSVTTKTNVVNGGSGGDVTASNNAYVASSSFVNAAGGNFHLASGSAAIGAGLDIDYPWDADEVDRGATPDQGAFEYVP